MGCSNVVVDKADIALFAEQRQLPVKNAPILGIPEAGVTKSKESDIQSDCFPSRQTVGFSRCTQNKNPASAKTSFAKNPDNFFPVQFIEKIKECASAFGFYQPVISLYL